MEDMRCAPLLAFVVFACGEGDRSDGAPDVAYEAGDRAQPDAEADADAADESDADAAPSADLTLNDAAPLADRALADATPPTPDCPEGIVCIDTLPHVARGTTLGAEARRTAYACDPAANESGPEVVFRVPVPHEGFLALALAEPPPGVDIDVHLLRADDPATCLDRGNWRAGAWVTPGEWWVVADTWVDDQGAARAGEFELSMTLTDAGALSAHGLAPEVGDAALRAFAAAWARGDTDRFDYAITDFGLHSSRHRQWIVDLASGELLWTLHVTHGENSADPADPGRAVAFSNTPESHQSSLGLMRSAETYTGDYGYSFRLDGLEPGYNDNVRPRDIVMHPWVDARPEYIDEYGYLRPSWGCPAIDDRVATEVVDRMSEGALYFFWYPDGDWSERSAYLP